MHGWLRSADGTNGVRWQHPAAKQLIAFRPTNIARIGFEQAQSISPPPPLSCWFRFRNGDELLGTLVSLDADTVGLETWFGGTLKAARQSVQSITFLPKSYAVAYEGPGGFDGWKLGRDPQAWQYRDGAFIATVGGTLGRDFKMTNSSSLQFDLAWTGPFDLILTLYTDVLDRLDYSVSSYLVNLGPGFVNVQRIQTGLGVIQLGQAQIPELLKRSEAHFELRTDRDEATLELFMDGALVQRWRDNRGFAGKGSGVVFFAQLEGSSLKLSNLRVCTWEGKTADNALSPSPAGEDYVYLVNRDKMTGSLRAFHDGKLSVATAQTALDIPLPRVTQIVLGSATTNSPVHNPRDIRAYFTGGGTLSFQLEQWEARQVSGNSANFGHVAFSAQPIRQLQFNLGRSARPGAGPGSTARDNEEWDE